MQVFIFSEGFVLFVIIGTVQPIKQQLSVCSLSFLQDSLTTSSEGVEALREALREVLPEVLREALPEVLREALPEVLREALPEVLKEVLPEVLMNREVLPIKVFL